MRKSIKLHQVRVIDGDTIETVGESPRRIRIFGIDAPEIGQRGGRAARERLKKIINGARVAIETTGKKSYDRIVARVRHTDGRDVGAMMVSDGYAVAVPFFTKAYVRYQNLAEKLGRGLWENGQEIDCPASWRSKMR